MPHITIEYSANLARHHDVDELVHVVHTAALATGVPTPGSLRTRAARRDHFEVADGSDDLAFIAIAVRVGPGRDVETKTSFIEALLDAGERHVVSESGPLAVAWSIELHEIDPAFRINRNHVRTRLADRQQETDGGTQN